MMRKFSQQSICIPNMQWLKTITFTNHWDRGRHVYPMAMLLFMRQQHPKNIAYHTNGIMSAVASQIIGVSIVWSTVWSKKTSKLRVTGNCEGNPPVTGGFPSERVSEGAACSELPWLLTALIGNLSTGVVTWSALRCGAWAPLRQWCWVEFHPPSNMARNLPLSLMISEWGWGVLMYI